MKRRICYTILPLFVAIMPVFLLFGCHISPTERTKYTLYLNFDESKNQLTGREELHYLNTTGEELTDLTLTLYGNAYREDVPCPVPQESMAQAYDRGTSHGRMDVTEVGGQGSWAVNENDPCHLTVHLSTPLSPNESCDLTVTYTLTLANVNHRLGVTKSTINLGYAYPLVCSDVAGEHETPSPIGDPIVCEVADFEVNLELPATYTAATSGTAVSESLVGERKKCTFTRSCARDFAIVLSDKFSVVKRDVGDVQVLYYYTNDSSPQTKLATACESLAFFENTFGAYDYDAYTVVQTGFCYGGMEFSALAMISDKLDSDDATYTIVHETAHQWWYEGVGSDQTQNAWQDEGLAEYSALLFFENNPGYAFTRTGLVGSMTKAYRAYFSVYEQLFGGANTAMNRPCRDFAGEYEYVNIAYRKGALLFEYLRQAMGDKAFLAALRGYYVANNAKIATVEDMTNAFCVQFPEAISFFDNFIQGKIIL